MIVYGGICFKVTYYDAVTMPKPHNDKLITLSYKKFNNKEVIS
jgi:hypothetical protein